MDKSELKFRKKKAIIQQFKNDLSDLVEKYKFGKAEFDMYDGMDNYSHTEYHFTIDGEPWYIESVMEILNDVFGPIGSLNE